MNKRSEKKTKEILWHIKMGAIFGGVVGILIGLEVLINGL